MQFISRYSSPLGEITLASDGTSLTGLWFEGQKYFGARLSDEAKPKQLAVFEQTAAWLDVYFTGQTPDFTPPLSFEGASPFRRRVWEILLSIPRRQLRTYGSIAKQIAEETGKAVSAQAVGSAVGHNVLSVIVPCHRVVGTDGSLTGYAGGLERKIALLRTEGADMTRLHLPK